MIRSLRSDGRRALLARLSFALFLLSPAAPAQDAPAPAPRLERAAALILDGDTPALRHAFAEWIPAANAEDTVELEAALALAAITVGPPFPGASEAWFEAQAPAAARSLRARLAWLEGRRGALPPGRLAVRGPFDNERGRGMRRRTPPSATRSRVPTTARAPRRTCAGAWRPPRPARCDGRARAVPHERADLLRGAHLGPRARRTRGRPPPRGDRGGARLARRGAGLRGPRRAPSASTATASSSPCAPVGTRSS